MPGNNKIAVNERRQKLFALLTRGMKGYEIARELKVTEATVSRNIQFLVAESQKYLNDLAKQTVPFMYQASIEGIRDVLKECRICNFFDRISAKSLRYIARNSTIKGFFF